MALNKENIGGTRTQFVQHGDQYQLLCLSAELNFKPPMAHGRQSLCHYKTNDQIKMEFNNFPSYVSFVVGKDHLQRFEETGH